MASRRICSFSVEVAPGPVCDLATVDALAQLALAARRLGLELRLAQAPAELLELIALAGLEQALCGQSGGQPEQREQPRGVEEEGQLRDAPG